MIKEALQRIIQGRRSEVDKQEIFRLSQAEIKYLKEEETGNYSVGELRRRIKRTRDKLPERIWILIEDLHHLNEEGYLDTGEWTEKWLKLMGVTDKKTYENEFSSLFEWGGISMPYFGVPGGYQLSYNIGNMMSNLMLYSENKDKIDIEADIVLGFIHGLRNVDGPEESSVDDLLPELEKRQKESTEWMEGFQDSFEENISYAKKSRDRTRARILARLSNQGLMTLEVSDGGTGEDTEREDWEPPTGISIVMEALEKEFGANWYLSEIDSNNSWEEIQEHRHLHKNIEPLEVTTADIREVIENENLERKIRFWRQVKEDRKTAQEEKWGGISPADVLEYLHEESKEVETADGEIKTSREINKNLRPGSGIGNLSVTKEKILPELAGQGENKDWIHRPLINKKGDGWKLTSYGKLLSHVLFDKEPWAKFHYIPNKEELVNEAVEEIETSI
jgi:hypothetical protein